MLMNDINNLKEMLYLALEQGDENEAYEISLMLDELIVEFYKSIYKN